MIAILVIIPLAAVLANFIGPRSLIKHISLGAVVLNLFLALVAALAYCNAQSDAVFNDSFWTGGMEVLATGSVTLNLSFGLGSVSVIMVILTAVVSVAAILSGKCPEGKERLWYNSSLLIAAGAMGAFLSRDLFFFYAFHELALIPTFLMIGILGRGDRKQIAWKATIYLAVGSIILLAGIVWLAGLAGTYELDGLRAGIDKQLAEGGQYVECQLCCIAGLLIVGFGTLVSLFPFHSWAAPAYASAPAPVAMLHAGVLKKFGLYGLIVVGIQVIPTAFVNWVDLLLVLLLCNIIWVGLITINQKRIDLMLGNSSVMHMGYIFLAIAAYMANPDSKIAIPAATLLMFAHGVSIAMSFSLTDVIERRTGTLELNQLGGLAKTAPNIAFLFGLVGMASIGLPGLANFAGEVMVFFSGFDGWKAGQALGNVQYATMIAIWGVVISAVYMLRAFKNTFHGQLVTSTKEATDITFSEKLPAIILGVTLLIVGIYPNILLHFIR